MRPKFTVDWEEWFSGTVPQEEWGNCESLISEPTFWLLRQLKFYCVKATFYCLGHSVQYNPAVFQAIKEDGHVIGSHGYRHGRNEWEPGLFRSPFWDTTPMPGWSGGVFFRVLPYGLLLRNLEKSGIFWIHPHDLLARHPRLKNPIYNFKRQIGLGGVREKLKRLLNEVDWRDPGSGS